MAICFGTGPSGHFYEFTDDICPWPRQGRALRRIRRMRGWSLRQLAGALDVGIVHVSYLERGVAKISTEERRLLGGGSV